MHNTLITLVRIIIAAPLLGVTLTHLGADPLTLLVAALLLTVVWTPATRRGVA